MINSKMQCFPVKKFYDNEKSKWQKVPSIPRGQDWHTYKASRRELEHATNIGLVVPTGVVVIDLDTDKGVTREAVEAALGCSLEWDGALIQRTVSGGQHYGFAIGDAFVRQGSNLLGVAGFDTRTSGKGWICTGDGYTDETLAGLPDGLSPEWLPDLPEGAIEILGGDPFEASADDDSDLMSAIVAQPCDVTEDEVLAYIAKLPEGDVDSHDQWLAVGMALHHQFGGTKRGAEIWRDWSKNSRHYDINEIKTRYKSFGRRNITDPTTFAYVIHRAGGRDAIAADKADDWIERAREVDTLDDYYAIKSEIKRLPYTELPKDTRAIIAAELAAGIGKQCGMTRTDIKGALKPGRSAPSKLMDDDSGGESRSPEWMKPWVYIEMTCEFANTALGYEIKREAFNAKYDRETECLIAEKQAASLALVENRLPTVVDKIFWPGADRLVTNSGMTMLNTYREKGVTPCDAIDEDGQAAIDALMAHIRFTLADEREQRILLDWLAYVVQNPGRRVGWALLLQGAQGTGKSYFCVLLQQILGDHVKNLDPTAIAGRFTAWATGSLVTVIEEIRMNGTNRYEVLDRMKPFITNETVQIEEKGRDHRTVPNFTSYMMLTNHKDAIPLTSGDRRYCVMFSRVQSETQLFSELGGEEGAAAYFDELFEVTRRRSDALARFLLDHEVSADFNPSGRAPDTQARQVMMGVSMSPERLAIEDAIERHECCIINDRILDITWLNKLCEGEGFELPKTRTLTAILLEMGYEQVEGKRIRINKTGVYHYVWQKENQDAKTTVKDYFDDPDFVPF